MAKRENTRGTKVAAAPGAPGVSPPPRSAATLAALRDALLPNLISGEIRIAHAEMIIAREV